MAGVNAATQLTKKPDIFDAVDDTDLANTPIFNQIEKAEPPENDFFVWGADAPQTPTLGGSPDNRAWASPASRSTRGDLKGRIQHREDDFGVGKVAQGNKVYATGGLSEYDYQAKGAMRLHITSCELTIISAQEAQAGSDSAQFLTRGLELWTTDTANIAAQTDTDTRVAAAFRPKAAACHSLGPTGVANLTSEDDLNAVLSAMATSVNAKVKVHSFCTLEFKQKVSSWGNLVPVEDGFQTVRRFNSDADEKRLGVTIDIFAGDAGMMTLEWHPFMRQEASMRAEALLLQWQHLKMRVREMPQNNKDLAKDGTRKRGQIFSTWGLQPGNPRFFGKFYTPAA